MTDPFLSFFSDESYHHNNSQEIVVIIDNTLKTMQEIYDHTGNVFIKIWLNVFLNNY